MKHYLFIFFLSIFISSAFSQSIQDSSLRPSSKTPLVKHQNYEFEYSEEHEQAIWVYYTLTPENLTGPAKRKNNFKSDPKVETGSAASKDYNKTGYDRGHLCPAASQTINQEAMDESFYMSNMSPQAPEFNRGKWKQLEGQVRSWVMVEKKLHVVSGPIFESNIEKIGENKVTAPGFYYKAIYDPTDEQKMLGFILPNTEIKKDISEYAVPIDDIEARTGIDFFSALPDSIENKLESQLINWEYITIKIIRESSDSTSNSVQCKGVAKTTGEQCKNTTSNSNGYCNLHQGQVSTDTEEAENNEQAIDNKCIFISESDEKCNKKTEEGSKYCEEHKKETDK